MIEFTSEARRATLRLSALGPGGKAPRPAQAIR